MEKKIEPNVEQEFYDKCAQLLGTTHEYDEWVRYTRVDRETGEQYIRDRSRWGPRKVGNGRYPGFGMIRRFGPSHIHVALTLPVSVNRVFSSEQDVYDFLSWITK
jgi:hypothetical protein